MQTKPELKELPVALIHDEQGLVMELSKRGVLVTLITQGGNLVGRIVGVSGDMICIRPAQAEFTYIKRASIFGYIVPLRVEQVGQGAALDAGSTDSQGASC